MSRRSAFCSGIRERSAHNSLSRETVRRRLAENDLNRNFPDVREGKGPIGATPASGGLRLMPSLAA